MLLLFLDLVHLGELLLRISVYELLNDHIASTNTDDKLPVQDLGIDLSRTEYVVTVSELFDGHWAVGLVNVLTYHLIEQVTSRHDLWNRCDNRIV